jgi:glutamine amidotransferase PdxT
VPTSLIGVLALQGDFEAHAKVLRRLGAQVREVRVPADLDGLEGLVLPGGESTTMTLGIEREGLAQPLRELADVGTPILGSCAGLIMLDREHLGVMDMRAERNAFGRQTSSFEAVGCSSELLGSPSTAQAWKFWRRSTATPWRLAKGIGWWWPFTRSSPRTIACTSCSWPL